MSITEYGAYGGQYVPETLMPALDELERGWREIRDDPSFAAELAELHRTYVGRPTPLYLAERIGDGRRIYLKREDLCHTGAHKINNAVGQALIARRLGKQRIVAETGAGQHGVASATVCARFGLECVVYMGAEDMERQKPNVERMHLLGAEVRAVEFGTRTLKEATSEAIRDWITNVETTHYLIGSCVGPHPYPEIVRELQSVIGSEARAQILEAEGRLPDAVVACVGGGSNAIGTFAGFVADEGVRLIGVEAAGAASLGTGRPGVLHGARSSILADDDGQIADAHSISAGPRLPGRRPRARLPARQRTRRVPARDRRGGARRAPSAGGARGDHRGARALARARPGAGARRGADRRLPLRPRRQGPRRRALARSMSKRLSVYLMALPETPELAEAAVEGGADLLELGFPFSDPLADGPVIRLAGERALQRGMRTQRCLECLAETRARVGPDVPLIPMTYASILEAYGYERFWADAQAAGATSLIVADLPLEAAPEVPRVQLVAPTSTSERIALAAARTHGWLYLVSLTGTTGARTSVSSQLESLVGRARAVTDVPLLAGFGISTPEQAAAAASLADGVVVGSRAVQVADESGAPGLREYVASLRAALDELAAPAA